MINESLIQSRWNRFPSINATPGAFNKIPSGLLFSSLAYRHIALAEGELRFPRRPIPINTTDWVSTPRAQFNAISGTQFLAGVEQLEIQQIIDLNTRTYLTHITCAQPIALKEREREKIYI